MNKRLEEKIKGLEEVILDHKKHIDSLKECCKTLDELKDAAINDMNKFKALMLDAVEELRKEKEEYRKIQEIPKPELPKTEYEYIMDLIKDVSDVVYNEFEIMTWSASLSVNTFNKPLEYVAHKRYVIKYNFYEISMALLDDYWAIDQVSTKALEEFRFHELLNILMEKLKDAGFTLHCHTDRHYGLSCGDTHIIEVWR